MLVGMGDGYQSAPDVIWYENNGSKNFTSHNISTDAQQVEGLFAIDIDQDGDLDVLAASKSKDKIELYLNDGSQNLKSQIITSNADGALGVFAIDLDRDSDIDILSTSQSDRNIVWYENKIIP